MIFKPKCVLQHDSSDCAAACLATVALHYGLPASIAKIREATYTTSKGTNVLGLVQAAERLGFQAKGVKGKESSLAEIPTPAIAHMKDEKRGGHFVVIHRIGKRKITIADPGEGVKKVGFEEFNRNWTGRLILLYPESTLNITFKKTSNWKRFFKLMAPHIDLLGEALFAALVLTLLGYGGSLCMKYLIDSVLPNESLNGLTLLMVLMGILFIMRTLYGAIRGYLLIHFSQKINVSLVLGFFRHIMRLPVKFFDTRRAGEILSRIGDATRIRSAVSSVPISIILDSFFVILGVSLMLYYNWKLAILMFMFMPLFVTLSLVLIKPLRIRHRALMEKAADLQAVFVESLTSMRTVKGMCLEGERESEVDTRIVDLTKKRYELGIFGIVSSSVSGIFDGAASLLLYWYGGYSIITGTMTIGELIFFASLIGLLYNPLKGLVGLNITIQNAFIAMDRLGEIMEVEQEGRGQAAIQPEKLTGNIRFQEVSFAYGNVDRTLVKVSFEVEPGNTVAIVGQSGSGKTTLFNLIMRFYQPNSGRILLDGYELDSINLDTLRRKVGYLAQDGIIFSGSVHENLTIGNKNAGLTEIQEAARLAEAHDFILRLPQGYNTAIGEKGVTIAGGERQRIALARIFLTKPDILLLDEATSHLDSITERRIYQSLNESMQESTLLMVAHRLSTVMHADKILVMKDGHLAEQGKHLELLVKQGEYRRLWQQQSQGIHTKRQKGAS